MVPDVGGCPKEAGLVAGMRGVALHPSAFRVGLPVAVMLAAVRQKLQNRVP